MSIGNITITSEQLSSVISVLLKLLAVSIFLLIVVGIIKLISLILKLTWNLLKSIFVKSENSNDEYAYEETGKYSRRITQAQPRARIKKQPHKDLDSLLLKTKCAVRIPRGKYLFNHEIYDRFMQNPYNEDNVNDMTAEILTHCDYKGKIPRVTYSVLWDELSKNYLDYGNIRVVINTKIKRPSGQLLGILIHECMNILAFGLKIDYPNNLKESGADVLAVYMGFYDYMVMGYNRIGYLRSAELSYIRREIEDYKRR